MFMVQEVITASPPIFVVDRSNDNIWKYLKLDVADGDEFRIIGLGFS